MDKMEIPNPTNPGPVEIREVRKSTGNSESGNTGKLVAGLSFSGVEIVNSFSLPTWYSPMAMGTTVIWTTGVSPRSSRATRRTIAQFGTFETAS